MIPVPISEFAQNTGFWVMKLFQYVSGAGYISELKYLPVARLLSTFEPRPGSMKWLVYRILGLYAKTTVSGVQRGRNGECPCQSQVQNKPRVSCLGEHFRYEPSSCINLAQLTRWNVLHPDRIVSGAFLSRYLPVLYKRFLRLEDTTCRFSDLVKKKPKIRAKTIEWHVGV